MLATIRDDTWNVLNMQHIIPNSERWNHSDTPGGGHKKIKGPAHMVEGGHHFREAPNPHPHLSPGPALNVTYTAGPPYRVAVIRVAVADFTGGSSFTASQVDPGVNTSPAGCTLL